MLDVRLSSETDLDGWSAHASALAESGVPPSEVIWSVGQSNIDLFGGGPTGGILPQPNRPIAPDLLLLARRVVPHSDPERFALLYSLVWRSRSEPGLVLRSVDPQVARAGRMAKAVGRDVHKMHAFVRFRLVAGTEPEQFVAWFEPDHFIEEAAAPFFARRFATMRWSILTPRRSIHWNGADLSFADGSRRSDAPDADALDDLWRTYYAHIFNPARLKVSAMRSEMPQKYWRNLPEARLIRPLIASAEQRVRSMVAEPATLPAPHAAAARRQFEASAAHHLDPEPLHACRRCPIGAAATQAVPGEGPLDARIMLIGEQPGDEEDLAGRPFVGPAGRLLDRALREAGLPREALYLTNAVKHFKFEPRGKRRIHKRPEAREVELCAPWLRGELERVDPASIVALGATAARAMLGRDVKIGETRGRFITLSERTRLMVTVHPAYVLRLPPCEQARGLECLVSDLRQVRETTEHDRVAERAA